MRLKDAPTDLATLARLLGHSPKAMTGLKAKHGDGLLHKLQREWWEAQDRPRFLHRNSSYSPSRDAPPGYTESTTQSLSDEPEAVPADYQVQITVEARKRAVAAGHQRLERLRRVQKDARRNGVDFEVHFIAIEARIRAMETALET